MKNKRLFILLNAIISAIIVAAFILYWFNSMCCTRLPQDQIDSNLAVGKCILACDSARRNGINLENGPCLSNNVTQGWVCDVAHSPRIAADNQPENQCPAFIEGKAKHFVEVDTNCDVIRAV